MVKMSKVDSVAKLYGEFKAEEPVQRIIIRLA
jgi:hypothetical protein